MSKITYIEKLKDPRWQKKRLGILNRDEFACRICGNEKKTLHVHHCGYSYDIKEPWNYPDSWLLTLCSDCHTDETEALKNVRQQLLEICYSFSFTSDDYNCLFDFLNESLGRGLKPCDLMTIILSKDREDGNEIFKS